MTAPSPGPAPLDVLVTGATGFVGGALVPALLDAGHRVRCLVRDPARLQTPWAHRVEVVTGRAEDQQAVWRAADGCDLAYYLVHGIEGRLRGLVERERAGASAFATGVETAGVRHVVYLGGLVDEERLAFVSDHLYARHEAGLALREGVVPVTELRAGIVIGVGSASFQLARAAAQAPVELGVSWAQASIQPLAVTDLVQVLVATAGRPAAGVLEIGGPDVLSYADLVVLIRTCLGRPAPARVRVPWLPPEASALAVAARAGVDPVLTLALLQSAREDTVVRDDLGRRVYAGLLDTTVEAAVRSALADRGRD